MKLKSIACLLLLSALPSMGAAVVSLPGNTKTSTWTNLNSVTYNSSNGYPIATTAAAWGPIAADVGSGSSVTFSKTSGPAYFISSGAGIYGYHTADSVYTIAESAPIANLDTLVLQGHFNLRTVTVTFSYNGGSQNIASTYFSNTPVDASTADYAWQWDLTGISTPITSYTLTISAQSSTFIYSDSPLSVTTSDSYTQVIPEPTTGLLALGSLAFAVTRRRRA